jgi:hypothetical protein
VDQYSEYWGKVSEVEIKKENGKALQNHEVTKYLLAKISLSLNHIFEPVQIKR